MLINSWILKDIVISIIYPIEIAFTPTIAQSQLIITDFHTAYSLITAKTDILANIQEKIKENKLKNISEYLTCISIIESLINPSIINK